MSSNRSCSRSKSVYKSKPMSQHNNSNVEKPYHSNLNVEKPYHSNLNVEKPYYANSNVERPYYANSNVESNGPKRLNSAIRSGKKSHLNNCNDNAHSSDFQRPTNYNHNQTNLNCLNKSISANRSVKKSQHVNHQNNVYYSDANFDNSKKSTHHYNNDAIIVSNALSRSTSRNRSVKKSQHVNHQNGSQSNNDYYGSQSNNDNYGSQSDNNSEDAKNLNEIEEFMNKQEEFEIEKEINEYYYYTSCMNNKLIISYNTQEAIKQLEKEGNCSINITDRGICDFWFASHRNCTCEGKRISIDKNDILVCHKVKIKQNQQI